MALQDCERLCPLGEPTQTSSAPEPVKLQPRSCVRALACAVGTGQGQRSKTLRALAGQQRSGTLQPGGGYPFTPMNSTWHSQVQQVELQRVRLSRRRVEPRTIRAL